MNPNLWLLPAFMSAAGVGMCLKREEYFLGTIMFIMMLYAVNMRKSVESEKK